MPCKTCPLSAGGPIKSGGFCQPNGSKLYYADVSSVGKWLMCTRYLWAVAAGPVQQRRVEGKKGQAMRCETCLQSDTSTPTRLSPCNAAGLEKLTSNGLSIGRPALQGVLLSSLPEGGW